MGPDGGQGVEVTKMEAGVVFDERIVAKAMRYEIVEVDYSRILGFPHQRSSIGLFLI